MTDIHADPEAAVFSTIAHAVVDQIMLCGLAGETCREPATTAGLQRAKASYAKLLHDLNGKIWLHGIPAIEQGSALQAARSPAARVRDAASRGDAAILQEVQRGGRYLVTEIQASAGNDRLPVHTLNYLQTVLSRVEAVRDDMEALSS